MVKSRKKQHFSKEASDDNVAMESPTPSSAKEAGFFQRWENMGTLGDSWYIRAF